MANDPPASMASTKSRVLGTLVAVVICNAVGILGALFTSTERAWYIALQKPTWQPPGWLFGPVWTLLYTLMGIALYRVYERRDQEGARVALILFAVQLFLNGIWSPIFFGAEAIVVALVVISVMVVMVSLTAWRFGTIDRIASMLLLPYLAWISFATVLNATIVGLN